MRMPYKSLKNNFKVNFDSTVFLSESSLPEVTVEDEGKMLIVEDGKWVVKTFDNKIEVDSTLTKPGMAADADAAGRRLRELESAVSNFPKPTKEDAKKCLRVNALGEWEILPIEEAVQTIATGVGLKTYQEEEQVVIDFDEEVVFVFDCGTADILVAILGETALG